MKKFRKESSKRGRSQRAATYASPGHKEDEVSFTLASGKQRLIHKVASKLAQNIVSQNLRTLAKGLTGDKGGSR